MNYGRLKDGLNGYMHRLDLDSQYDYFQELVNGRMDIDIDIPELEEVQTYDTTVNPAPLPDDFMAVRVLSANGRNLTYEPPIAFNLLYPGTTTSGVASSYTIKGQNVVFGPYVDGMAISLLYKARITPMVTDTETNQILDKFPAVYQYAMMMEAHIYVQDLEAAQLVGSQYDAEVSRLRIYADNYRYNNPAVRGI